MGGRWYPLWKSPSTSRCRKRPISPLGTSSSICSRSPFLRRGYMLLTWLWMASPWSASLSRSGLCRHPDLQSPDANLEADGVLMSSMRVSKVHVHRVGIGGATGPLGTYRWPMTERCPCENWLGGGTQSMVRLRTCGRECIAPSRRISTSSQPAQPTRLSFRGRWRG